jgi:hypothetical protein
VVPVGLDAGTSAMEVDPDPAAAGEVPPGVQKLPDSTGAKTNKYVCDTCNVTLNSEIQLEQVSSHCHSSSFGYLYMAVLLSMVHICTVSYFPCKKFYTSNLTYVHTLPSLKRIVDFLFDCL